MIKFNELVAVYGSLRQGGHNHHLLIESEFLGQERTTPSWQMRSLGAFPAVCHGNDSIVIEVYRLFCQKISHNLDYLEGYIAPGHSQNFYEKVSIATSHGRADFYIMTSIDSRHIVESGDWIGYLSR